jgi:hypothetical protein
MGIEEELSKVRIYINKMSNGKFEITCMKPVLGGAGHHRPYNSEAELKEALLALGLGADEVDGYVAAVRESNPMELLNLGDYTISDVTLQEVGFTAV